MADANFEAFFSSGGASMGLYPVFPPKGPIRCQLSNNGLRGFTGAGDTIRLPTATGVGGTLEYLNSSGTLVWSKVPTDINAACTNWVSFNLDTADNALWCVALAPGNTLYTAKINAAGTVTNVGNATTSSTLTASTFGWGGSGPGNRWGASLRRATPGTGSFALVGHELLLTINDVTGAISGESVKTGLIAGAYPSTSGAYVSVQNLLTTSGSDTPGQQTIAVQYATAPVTARVARAVLIVPTSLGLPYHSDTNGRNSYSALQWASDVVVFPAGVGVLQDAFAVYDPVEFSDAIDALIGNFRLDVTL